MFRSSVILIFGCLLIADLHGQLAQNKLNIVQENQAANNNPSPLVKPGLPSQTESLTSLAKSAECRADVQKYCVKKGAAILVNLKVLKCINDLDDVSASP